MKKCVCDWWMQKALSLANAAKSQGNTLYAAGKFLEALECYASALEGVANDPSANELRAQCYSNRAICEINLVIPNRPQLCNIYISQFQGFFF